MTLTRPMFPPRAEETETFAALAAAVHPAWHQAIIRLANATERVAKQLEAVMPTPLNDGMVGPVRELVRDLIDYLDLLERAGTDLEPDEGAEPSLGWAEGGRGCAMGDPGDDREHDDSDDEDADPREPSLGSLNHDDQTRWGHSARADLEEQCDDEGSAA